MRRSQASAAQARARSVAGPAARSTIDAGDFSRCRRELALRVLGRVIDWTGDEGPVELGKLEALCDAAAGRARRWLAPMASRRFRRTLAGALVTLDGWAI